jgi:succinyl-CoA synthetase beta subunit
MKIHEYQAKQIMSEFGVPVPKGRVAATPQEARQVAQELGVPVVIKAQIHAGGRGKGGGIKLADTPAQAEDAARQIIGMRLITHQTGPEGRIVKRVLVEEQVQAQRELYLGIVVDSGSGRPVVMASEAGGVDIEQVAAASPEKIHKAFVDPFAGFQPYLGRQLAFATALTGDVLRPAVQLMTGLYRAFTAKDASWLDQPGGHRRQPPPGPRRQDEHRRQRPFPPPGDRRPPRPRRGGPPRDPSPGAMHR